MNKTELIAAAAEKAGLSKKDTEKAVTAALDAITEALVKGDKVQLAVSRSRSVASASAAILRPRKRSRSPRPRLRSSRPARR